MTKSTLDKPIEVLEAICDAADAASNEWHAFAASIREHRDQGLNDIRARATLASNRVDGVFRALRDIGAWEDDSFDSTFRVQPAQAVRGLHEANVTTIAELRQRLEAGTLENIKGVGPAAVRDIRKGLGWVDQKYAEARERLANLVGPGGDA